MTRTPLRIPGTNTYPDASVICRSCRKSIRPGEPLVVLIFDGNPHGTGPAECALCAFWPTERPDFNKE